MSRSVLPEWLRGVLLQRISHEICSTIVQYFIKIDHGHAPTFSTALGIWLFRDFAAILSLSFPFVFVSGAHDELRLKNSED